MPAWYTPTQTHLEFNERQSVNTPNKTKRQKKSYRRDLIDRAYMKKNHPDFPEKPTDFDDPDQFKKYQDGLNAFFNKT